MKTLHLNLKKKWFDMILSGEKKEEYREIKEYWIGRLIRFLWVNDMVGISYLGRLRSGNYDKISFYDYDTITFSNGYSKNRPQFEIELKGMEVRGGEEKWGAEINKKYFVLTLGKVVEK